jgi:LPXTG-site transpeptidase (sortase) family protein
VTIADAARDVDVPIASSEPAVEPPDVEVDAAAPEPARRGRRWVRTVVLVLLALLGVALVYALFTGPLEEQWYESRQRHLAADLQEARTGLKPGQALGVLQVPRLGVNVMVVEGDSADRLRGGPGHRIGTVRPGVRGNSVILGHRTKWGGPFSALGRVREGDLVAVQSRHLKSGEFETFVYRVRSVAKVTADGSRRLMSRSSDYRLTLVTGRGGTLSEDRLVVSAVSGRARPDSMRAPAVRATTPGPSIVFNAYLLLAVLSFALAVIAFRYLRHRAGRVAKAFVLVPLLVAGTVFLLLDITLMLPPVQ